MPLKPDSFENLPWLIHKTSGPKGGGFGLAPPLPAETEGVLFSESFYWPLDGSDADRRKAMVCGSLTADKKTDAENAAIAFLYRTGGNFINLMWRLEPTWESGRDIEHDTMRHILRMRGFFWGEKGPIVAPIKGAA